MNAPYRLPQPGFLSSLLAVVMFLAIVIPLMLVTSLLTAPFRRIHRPRTRARMR